MLRQIAEKHPDIKMIYMTGDNPTHDLWRQTLLHNTEHTRAIVEDVAQYFPDVNVYVSLGNHEAHPTDQYVDTAVVARNNPLGTGPLYDTLADIYSAWMPSGAIDQFRENGFYSWLAYPGLRIIGINSNFHYGNNL